MNNLCRLFPIKLCKEPKEESSSKGKGPRLAVGRWRYASGGDSDRWLVVIIIGELSTTVVFSEASGGMAGRHSGVSRA